jgi:hypothetical protein
MQNVVQVIENTEEFADCQYFEDIANPKTCAVCALGALIRNLPDDKYENVMEALNGSRGKWLNGASIEHPDAAVLAKPLMEHYGLRMETLIDLQRANDTSDGTLRRKEVLEIAKGTLRPDDT